MSRGAQPACAMVVEDEAALRESLLEALRHNVPGTEFHGFGSVEDAKEHLDRLNPRLIISDIQLPGQNGVEFLLHLREHRPNTRVALMSAYGPLIDEEALEARGAVSFLRKPFDISQLVSVVERHNLPQKSGTVEGIGLSDILQVLHMGRRSVRAIVDCNAVKGEIHMRDGALVSAWTNTKRGLQAAYDLLGTSRCRFSIVNDDSPCARDIDEPFSFILLECARLADEEKRTPGEDRNTAREPRPSTGALSEPYNQPVSMQAETERNSMPQINLEPLTLLDGFIGACVVDSESGMVLATLGGGERINLEIAAAGNTEVIRAKRKTVKSLQLNDQIEDILISLGNQYHIMRPLETNDALFLYLALDRQKANLGLARHQAKQLEKTMEI